MKCNRDDVAQKAFEELVNSATNPLTREALAALIELHPERWSRFDKYLDTLPSEKAA